MMPKNQPHPIREQEQKLIQLYCDCPHPITPQQFYAKWDVKQVMIADICSRSLSTVQCWFATGKRYRRPRTGDLRHLAVMDFLLEHYDKFPEPLKNLLCPTDGSTNPS
jgi:hypothetical protein